MKHSKFPTLYLNENISIKLLPELKKRDIHAVHTIVAGNRSFTDEQQLHYSSRYKYILVTHNRKHFKKIHFIWQSRDLRHSGILLVKFEEVDVLAKRIEKFMINVYPHVESCFCLSPPSVN